MRQKCNGLRNFADLLNDALKKFEKFANKDTSGYLHDGVIFISIPIDNYFFNRPFFFSFLSSKSTWVYGLGCLEESQVWPK